MTGFYSAFEARHRGSREDIKSRLWVYGPFLADVKTLRAKPVALDLGCGRGEFLEILRETDIEARGIDLDAEAVAACTALGLTATQGDALAALRAASDASLDLVTAFHVVEHLAVPDMVALVAESLRVLRPAGLLILETPNPENLNVGAHRFYLDPTHQRPVPPELLAFLPEHAGYRRTTVMRLNEPPELGGNPTPALQSILTEVSPDYAVVAQKDAPPDVLARFDTSFGRAYGVSLKDLAQRYDHHRGHYDTETHRWLAGVDSRVARLEKETAEAIAREGARAAAAEEELRLVRASASWKLTAPLRWLAAMFKGGSGR
jgi:O-antigen chain-terminating methyltransferase